jgi:hypothetical protein
LVTEDKIIPLPSRLLSKTNLKALYDQLNKKLLSNSMSKHSDYYLLVMVLYWFLIKKGRKNKGGSIVSPLQ